jgi:hypothetical protein
MSPDNSRAEFQLMGTSHVAPNGRTRAIEDGTVVSAFRLRCAVVSASGGRCYPSLQVIGTCGVTSNGSTGAGENATQQSLPRALAS